MRHTDLNNRLKQHLSGAGIGIPIHWPNVEPVAETVRPCLIVNFPMQERFGDFISADAVREVGLMDISIITRAGGRQGEDQANNIADSLAQVFHQGLRLDFPGGTITVERPLDIKGGYRDETDWRVPTLVYYTALPR